MLFSELINITGFTYSEELFKKGLSDFNVKGLSFDSREIKEDFVFFAVKGEKEDGSIYAKAAVKGGAKAIITDMRSAENLKTDSTFNNIHIIGCDNIRKSMAEVSSVFFEKPSSKLRLIGVTGTNGKTTITYLIKKILETAGYKCGLIGTVAYCSGSKHFMKSEAAHLTTPDSVENNYMMKDMVDSGFEFCAMEVSSIGLEYFRVHKLDFDTAVFTNLTSEHMDLHRNMENYFNAKKILFDGLNDKSKAISNRDDEYGTDILAGCNAIKSFYSIKSDSDFRAENIIVNLKGLKFDLNISGKHWEITSSLTGRFNVYNILAAIVCCVNLGIDSELIISGIRNFEAVKGRFNTISLPNSSFAIIDYSHTSDSLRNAIEAAIEVRKNEAVKGRVITIFGCGGNRDRTKRAVMGRVATELSDYVIITSDNPRFENPDDIISEIKSGIDGNTNYDVEPDRDAAIKMGIEMSKEGDIILICGKGHETYQEINGVKFHFDDKEVVNKYESLVRL